MKKNIYLTILTFVTVLCIIGGTCYHVIGWGVSLAKGITGILSHNGTESVGNLKNDTITLDSFSNITADVNVMNLTVATGESYSISYASNEKLIPEYEVKDNTLTLKQKNLKFNSITGNKKCTVTVTVPDSLQNLQIDANVGDVNLDGISAESLVLNADVGDIDVTDCSFDQVKAEAAVGDVDFEDSSFQNMEISNDVGDVSVSAENLSNYQMNLSTDIGEVSVNDKNYRKSYKCDGYSGSKLIIENNTGDIEVDYR